MASVGAHSSAGSFHSDDPRRGAARHKLDSVRCDLGELVDLSNSGLRVTRKGKPAFKLGQCVQVRLAAGGQALSVTAQAVWMKRAGLRQYTIGMRFINISPPQRKALESVAQFGFFRRGSANTGTSRGWNGEPANQQWRHAKPSQSQVRIAVDLPDYYGILGVDASATVDEIRAAYRKLVRQYHPDVASNPDSASQFEEVQNAYEMLKDPERRESYDARLAG